MNAIPAPRQQAYRPNANPGLPARRKLPPFAKHLDPAKLDRSIALCTGSDAWDRCDRNCGWMEGCKVLLPFRDDPDIYRWDFTRGRYVVIYGFGESEPRDTLHRLSMMLINQGANTVLWGGQFDGNTPIDDAPLSQLPAPAFRIAKG